MKGKSKILIFSLFAILISGCSGLKHSESKKRRQINLVVEPIKRQSHEKTLSFSAPKPTPKNERYPWQHRYIGSLRRITKEHFRCKGDPLNFPVRVVSESNQVTYQMDCGRIGRHSLPLREGKEFIYPILIHLLNTIQEQTGKRVVITSGHRCPTHNSYVDPSKKNRLSKHLMGAEVDFYVEDLEYGTEKVLQVLQGVYQEDPEFKELKEGLNQWQNKEVRITLHSSQDRRNKDNGHAYPYFTIEVLYDREAKKPVHFSWQQGYNAFHQRD